jgi:hypothetical protein
VRAHAPRFSFMIERPSMKGRRGSGRRCGRGGVEGRAEDASRAFQNRFPSLGNLCFAWVWVAPQRGSKERSVCDSMSYLRSWRVFAHAAGRERMLSERCAKRSPLRPTPPHPAKNSEKKPQTGLAHTIFTGFFGALLGGALVDGLMSTPST